MLYFENQSKSPELDWLREGLPDMLITNLSRSSHLSVLSPQQLHSLPDAGPVSLEKAVEVGRKSRAEALALGRFAKLGEKIRIDVQLLDTRTGRLLGAESFVAGHPEEILRQVDLLAVKLASNLARRSANRRVKPVWPP